MALKGIKVVEFAGLAPGPFAGLVLADWGADVVRVDRPSATGAVALDTLTRHKRSVVLDAKAPCALEVLRRLVASADVLLDPFRPGVMERMGLGPEVFLGERGVNKRLVYARLAGFAHTDQAGHDINYLALSGVLSMLPGENGKPTFPLNLLADFGGGGLMCALGILLALFERQSSCLGQVVGTDMVSGTRYLSTFPLLAAMQWPYKIRSPVQPFSASPDVGSKLPTTRMRHLLDGGAPFYNVYTCADGRWISLGCIEPQFYKVFLDRFVPSLPPGFIAARGEALGLTPQEQYDTDRWPLRKKLFEKAFALYERDHWTKVFEGSDACAFPVLSPAEAAALATVLPANPDVAPAPHPRLSRTPARPLPVYLPEQGLLRPGQHTIEVLAELGLGKSEIEKLGSEGAFGGELEGKTRSSGAGSKL